MTELLSELSYDLAVRSGSLIVNVDEPTRVVRFHPAPDECPGLREGFVTKVVVNQRATGSYWAVAAESAARQRWGNGVLVCKRCG
jgi:hypothetical protein